MEITMKKIVNEFKEFINKGSVMDLAVGMIIGSAFTAIVSALVKSILTPLINWIPGSKQTGSLRTMLRPAIYDANGNILSEALVLDWGAVVGAIITFILTALVLFFLIKAVNKVKQAGEKVKSVAEDIEKKIKYKMKGESQLDAVTSSSEEAEIIERPLPIDEIRNESDTTQDLLRQIIQLLKDQK